MSFAIAAMLRPFAVLLVLWLICHPIKRAAWRILPDGTVRRVLFLSWRV